MRPGECDWSLIVRFSHEFQRRFAFGSARANLFFGLWSLRRTNNWNLWFDDSSFFSCDFRNCFAQPLFVIEINWRNHGNIRLNGVRSIEAATETGFQDTDLDLHVREVLEGKRGHHFEKCRMRIPVSDNIAYSR